MALNKTLDELILIAKGKGDRNREFKFKDRISAIEKNFQEIKKGHIKNKDISKIESIRDYIQKNEYLSKVSLKDPLVLNKRDNLVCSINLYLLHEKQRKVIKKGMLKVAFASMLTASSIFIPNITSKNDDNVNFSQNMSYEGNIPIYLFHRFNDSGKKYSVSLKSFEDFLERKYNQGYYLATKQEYLDNNFSSWRKPMMITFDDGDPSQIEAINALEKFCERYPDFGKALVLCINDPDYSFGLFEEKLKKFYSEKNWAEFSLHTQNHKPLNNLSIDQCINGEIEQEYEKLERYLGKGILKVDSLACPYIIAPTKEILEAIKNYTYHSRHGDIRINYIFGDCGIAENSKGKKFSQWNIKRICIENESELK